MCVCNVDTTVHITMFQPFCVCNVDTTVHITMFHPLCVCAMLIPLYTLRSSKLLRVCAMLIPLYTLRCSNHCVCMLMPLYTLRCSNQCLCLYMLTPLYSLQCPNHCVSVCLSAGFRGQHRLVLCETQLSGSAYHRSLHQVSHRQVEQTPEHEGGDCRMSA